MPSPSEPTPPSSTSSNGASPNGVSPENPNFRVVRKRNRIPLSCGPCRHRKLKCNRGHPCDNCTKRGDTSSCSYATLGSRKKGAGAGPNASPDDMQNRIDRLESLVLSLMSTGGQTGPDAAAAAAASVPAGPGSSQSESISTPSMPRTEQSVGEARMGDTESSVVEENEVDGISRGIGIMKMDGQRTIFASEAHWYAILGELSEVKKHFENHKEDYKEQMRKVQASKANETPGTAFLLQGTPLMERSELAAAYPSKANADRLIARYFNAYDPSVHIIHGPSFQQQYDNYWLNPNDTPIIWLGMNFAMMTLALQSYHRAGDEPPEYRGRSLELSHDYRRLTAQCLLLADITQPVAQTLETLILHAQAEYGRSRDAEPGVLLISSLCVRLAMRMGYHRDPGPHPAVSPFQGEVRRRVWTFVRQFDLMISFQFGLPSMVRSDQSDTKPPRNIFDDELYEGMKSLPISRPMWEATPMSYMITKSGLAFLLGRVLERVQSVSNPPSYDETLKFDAELRERRSQHPPLLKMRSFQESARDPANLIMQRIGLEMVFLRALFVLHRGFVAQGRENPRYAFSRRTCLDTSLELLQHQATLHRESQPGGRLRSVKWYISSMTTHDFLLAAMLICLDLHHTAEAERRGQKPVPSSPPLAAEVHDEVRREQMIQAVEYCISIWESVRDQSMEAYKACVALRVMVDSIRDHNRKRSLQQPSPSQQQLPPQPPSNILPSLNAAANISGYQRGSIPGYPQRNMSLGMFANGSMDMHNDELPPEQSAAMTLGMLSSGGVSPSPGFGMGYAGSNGSGSALQGTEKSAFPASMAALLNDQMATERTGLTPHYTGNDGTTPGGPLNAPSPMTQMINEIANSANEASGVGAGGGMMNIDGIGGEIDWSAWDSYIQSANNTSMAAAETWPMQLDLALDSNAPVSMGVATDHSLGHANPSFDQGDGSYADQRGQQQSGVA